MLQQGPGDGEARRRQEGGVRIAGERGRDLVAGEPARVVELGESMVSSSPTARAWQPIISDDGNGQGWLAT